MAKAKKRKRSKELEEHVRALGEVLDEIFARADQMGMGDADIARESGLSYTTIWRHNYRVSEHPRFETIRLMAQAVGLRLDVNLVESGAKPKLKLRRA